MVKVAVLGAGGGIGQPLSLLLKLSPYVSELSLFDIKGAEGVATDLSHINSPAVSRGFEPQSKDDTEAIAKCLKGCKLVIIPAGVPRKPGMTRDDLFKINAGIVRSLTSSIAVNCPEAIICIISNPVNSTVPIAVETLKKHGVFNPKKVFGVTTLDLVRAETFLGDLLNTQLPKGAITVVGGHSGDTIVPLFNDYADKLSSAQLAKLVHRVQFGGDEVVNAKKGAGSATLSMACAGYRFAEDVLKAMAGKSDDILLPDPAFVYLPGVEGGAEIAAQVNVDYFAAPVVLKKGTGEAERVLNPFKVTKGKPHEKKLVAVAVDGLKKNIQKGVQFVIGGAKL